MQPTQPLARVTLTSGYRSYRPRAVVEREQAESRAARKRKTVRFVSGYVTGGIHPDGWVWTPPRRPRRSGGEGGDLLGSAQSGQAASCGCDGENKDGETRGKDGKPAGRFVERSGIMVWRKEPRWRGSGALPLLDDPVSDGEALARSRVCLPSDRWRDVDVGLGVKLSAEDGTGLLRYEEGERDAAFTLDEIVHEDRLIFARVVPGRRKRSKSAKKSSEVEEEAPELHPDDDEEEAVPDSGALTEAESDSETGDEHDYDFMADLSLEDAEGWVPVMVAEEDGGDDDWMSLTGSWILMAGAADARK